MEERYNFHAIERKWRQAWQKGEKGSFPVSEVPEMSSLRRLYAVDAAKRYWQMRRGVNADPNAVKIPPLPAWVGPVVFRNSADEVDPGYALEMYSEDATRLYLLFAAPLHREVKWDTTGVEGAYKFINRVWNLGVKVCRLELAVQPASADGEKVACCALSTEEQELWRCVQQTLRHVTEQLERGRKYNTAISAIMVMVHALEKYLRVAKRDASANCGLIQRAYDCTLLLLAPFAPYVTEEIWHALGHTTSVHAVGWPECDAKAGQENAVNVVVQVNGRLCHILRLPADIDEAGMKRAALSLEKVKAKVAGKRIQRVVFVRPRLVNFVVEETEG